MYNECVKHIHCTYFNLFMFIYSFNHFYFYYYIRLGRCNIYSCINRNVLIKSFTFQAHCHLIFSFLWSLRQNYYCLKLIKLMKIWGSHYVMSWHKQRKTPMVWDGPLEVSGRGGWHYPLPKILQAVVPNHAKLWGMEGIRKVYRRGIFSAKNGI